MGEESIMRSKWVKKLNASIPRWYNMRMGKLPDVDMARAFMVIQGYADLVFIVEDVVFIVEFKIRNFRSAVGQLLSYKQEFPSTPEFEPWKNLPIQMRLVASKKDEVIEKLAAANDILFEVFNS